ncbi:MAG TPA: FkbM family methyltransferase [Polyangiaceae bacterium]|nr:FkbM family methyltransferase [Polyangiaceae bacterium]
MGPSEKRVAARVARADGRPSICLTMIVKNEAAVLERCLRSVRPFIDCWSIVDTGSSDGTQRLLAGLLADLPGELHQRPWQDFGHNRTEALTLSRAWANYSLVIDADETFDVPAGFAFPMLTADGYYTRHRGSTSTVTFELLQLLKSDAPWRYEGILHEVAVCDRAHRTEVLNGPLCIGHFDGARNQLDSKQKYARDAEVLEHALEQEPDNARYRYYLARSYRDAGMLQKALENFAKRADMGGWDEEVWHSLHSMGCVAAELNLYHAAVAAQLRAHQLRPQRAEALCALAQLHRTREEHHLAYLFARQAAVIPRPCDRLFVDDSVYLWRALDELSVAAYWVGEYEESRKAGQELLQRDAAPANERPRLEENLRFAEQKLGRGDMARAVPVLASTELASSPPTPSAAESPTLLQLVPLDRPIRIVDVGSSPVDGPPPFQPLVDQIPTEVIGFEPNAEARAELEARLKSHETVRADALGDGHGHTLHFCRAPGMNSLFEPDPIVLERFHLFADFATVVRTEAVRTQRLDDVEGVRPVDFLKLDVQGFEKTILEHGRQTLEDCLVVHTEAAFVPMYRNQPCLGEVDTLLRELGFVAHTLFSAKRWGVAPLLVEGNPRRGFNQLLDGDIVYVRSFFELASWESARIARLAHILHFVYGSFDVVYYLLCELTRRRVIAAETQHQYLALCGLR